MAQPQYQMQHWTRKVWQSDSRYYRAEITQDLFGQWTLERQWSGLWQKGGRKVVELLDSVEQGLQQLDLIHKQRLARGYNLIESF